MSNGVNGPPWQQRWPMPESRRPIVIIGAGGIVRDAHLPAYRAAGFTVAGVFDLDTPRAERLAADFAPLSVYASLEAALAIPDAVFDLALPPQAMESVLARIPEGAGVLLQKPFGRDLAEATRLLALCRARRLRAAVNFQLRFSPGMLALRDVVARGSLGEITDVDVTVRCRMPWHLWPFLAELHRMELPLHSIHYLDAIRALLGEPSGVYAKTVKHPLARHLASSRSSVILDYGSVRRVSVVTNHHHPGGPEREQSDFSVDGTTGSVHYSMGVNLDYPRGRPDRLRVARSGAAWEEIPLLGSWFPDAFRGPMSNMLRYLDGDDPALVSPVEDAWRTMALIEACHQSSDTGATAIPTLDRT